MKKTTYTKKDNKKSDKSKSKNSKVKMPKKTKVQKEIERLENQELELTNVYKYKCDCIVTPYIREKNNRLTYDKTRCEGLLSSKDTKLWKFYLDRDFGTHAPGGKLFKNSIIKQNDIKFREYGYSEDVIFNLNYFKNCDSIYVGNNDYFYVYNNTNTSSWRPKEITVKHFLSSMILFLEVKQFIKINFSNDNSIFFYTYEKDHIPRLVKFLKKNYNPMLKKLIYSFNTLNDFNIQIIETVDTFKHISRDEIKKVIYVAKLFRLVNNK